MPASVTMKAAIWKVWISEAHAAPNSVPPASTSVIMPATAAAARAPAPGQHHGRQRHDRAHREVDAAGQDHEGHADRHHQQEGVVDQQVQQHLAGEEAAVGERARREHGHEERAPPPNSGSVCAFSLGMSASSRHPPLRSQLRSSGDCISRPRTPPPP
jgi:hypothetical protein